MGLLDRIINRATRQLTNKAVDAAANGIVRSVEQKIVGNSSSAGSTGQTYQTAQRTASTPSDTTGYADDGRPAREKLLQVLSESFGSYEVRENVSPTTIGGTGKFMDYSIAVYAGGQPKLFIMLIGRNTCSTRLYRWSKEQAERAGVTMINFIEHYPNELEYIRTRLQQYL